MSGAAHNGIAVGRILVGASFWLLPGTAARISGLDFEANPQLSVVARLAGTRDIALGAGALRASDEDGDLWLAAGVACDLADAAAFVWAGAKGQVSPALAAAVSASAAAYAALGLWLLRASPRRSAGN